MGTRFSHGTCSPVSHTLRREGCGLRDSVRMWRRLAGWCTAIIMGKTKKSFYAVRRGRSVGVYNSWWVCSQIKRNSGGGRTRHHFYPPSTHRAECEAQVKGYPRAVYKGFATQEEAESFAYPGKTTSARERYSGHLPSTRHVPCSDTCPECIGITW